ncbi:hypothetical protein [Verrucomicrobium sp. BvORR034]|jgi:hypothetical protein|uniref:hypothetical protein n=1 Tax=Verrucomicrobium sp. BvORR034 TaxID=1396418 RepID=UPI0006785FA4|nr:hypothetical protein [Verrucomicrobium sp. BvORR034]
MLRFPPPLVGTLAIIQASVIVVSILVVRTFHKLYELHAAGAGLQFKRLSGMLEWMLSAGPLLLLVPLVWGLAATLWADTEGRVAMITPRQSMIGVGLTVALGLFCAMTVLMSMKLLVRGL